MARESEVAAAGLILDGRSRRTYGWRASSRGTPAGEADSPPRSRSLERGRMPLPIPAVRTVRRLLPIAALAGLAAILWPARAAEPARAVPIDFSHCGYGGGGVALPAVPAAMAVAPSGGDDTANLQEAIGQVAGRPAAADGFRGAVQLSAGDFRIDGHLSLPGGVVLRGSADAGRPTRLIATGRDRRTLIETAPLPAETGMPDRRKVTDASVPAGGRRLALDRVEGLAAGDLVEIVRPSTREWIHELGMDQFAGHFKEIRLDWAPGSRDLAWIRTIAAVDPAADAIDIDAPITTAIEARFGGASVRRIAPGSRLQRIGIERLTLVSECDPASPRDEEHSWIAISLDGVDDAWVRRVTAQHFAGAAVWVGPGARRITVEDCRSEQPVSEPGGYRRLSFFVCGQQVLVQRCAAEEGWDDFGAGLCAAGPNVFLDCAARAAIGDSGPFESWSSGLLYENVRVEGAGLSLTNDSRRSQGGGWNAANSVAWNCTAARVTVKSPPGAPNLEVTDPSAPSLYRSQLAARLGPAALSALEAGPLGSAEAPRFSPAAKREAAPAHTAPGACVLAIENGRFVIGGNAIWGSVKATAWWKGQVSPPLAANLGVCLTRFVPGRTGRGLTEDLERYADALCGSGGAGFQEWPGLWYERRRDEHTLVSRPDTAVWAPFYEMPWARSGQGTANDGLSKFDLSRFNPWYFDRLRTFAELCGKRGLILFHNLYNTHNVLETGAHWVDCPWRPANCINDTGLPEPAFDADGHSVHIANTFFDAGHPGRRSLHRAYIRHNLNQLGSLPNVVHGLAFQYAGPLEFQQFFLDEAAAWSREHGRRLMIALTTSKDVTDAILADPARGPLVSVIDLRYWQYMPDGTLYAPRAGRNLAFREMSTQQFGKAGGDTAPPTTPEQVYRQVREYRDRYPDKAIVAWHGGCGPIPVLMAGGALALVSNPSSGQTPGPGRDDSAFDAFVRRELAAVLPAMTPDDDLFASPARAWCLTDRNRTWLLYSLDGPALTFKNPLPRGVWQCLWFNPRTGETRALEMPRAEIAGAARIMKPDSETWLLLLRRKPPIS